MTMNACPCKSSVFDSSTPPPLITTPCVVMPPTAAWRLVHFSMLDLCGWTPCHPAVLQLIQQLHANVQRNYPCLPWEYVRASELSRIQRSMFQPRLYNPFIPIRYSGRINKQPTPTFNHHPRWRDWNIESYPSMAWPWSNASGAFSQRMDGCGWNVGVLQRQAVLHTFWFFHTC